MTERKKALLAAGGTGGHLFPALALAEELANDGWDVTIATDERGAQYKDRYTQYRFEIIESATVKPGLIGKFKTLSSLGHGTIQSAIILRTFRPDIVVGFGGYPCFPPLFAAQIAKIPTVIHEANAVLGKANKYLAAGASKIALSLPKTRGVTNHPKFDKKAVVTGNPVRSEIAAKENTAYPDLKTDGTFRILSMGGSQGASVFSDVIPSAIKKLPDNLKKRLYIAQQCREEDIRQVRKIYEDMGVQAELKTFFNDVPEQLEKCHLFIGRSGASTVSDIAVVGRPAIFVPLKHSDNQQKLNADVIADIGGAWVMMQDGFTADALAARLETLASLPDTLKKAAHVAAGAGQPKAARNLADVIKSVGR